MGNGASGLAFACAALGVLTGSFVTYLTLRQTNVSEKTYERTSGHVQAKLALVEVSPKDDDISGPFWKKTPFGWQEVYFDDLDKLLALNFRVRVRNTGEEPIDELRVETRFVGGGIFDPVDRPQHFQRRKKTPWVLDQAKREEYSLSQKLTSGQEAEVSLARGLVAQMVQAQATDERIAKDHLGFFEVHVFGRIVAERPLTGPTVLRP